MNRKATTSIVYKSPYPEMFIPEQLRSEITIKQFWYQKLISLCVALWYLGTKPLRKSSSKVSDEKPALEVKMETSEKETD